MLSKVWSGIAPIQFTLLTDVDATVIQGTKVLESSEIRTRVHTVREGAPPTEAMAPVTKYDGNQREPQWVDIERGTTVDSVVQLLCRCPRSNR